MPSPLTAALSPRPFTVTVKVPDPFDWNKITQPLYRTITGERNVSDEDFNAVARQYAHLIRLASWSKGIDWEADKNSITLVVPNDLNNQSRWDTKNNRYNDGLSLLLTEILKDISVSKLLSYFTIVKPE